MSHRQTIIRTIYVYKVAVSRMDTVTIYVYKVTVSILDTFTL